MGSENTSVQSNLLFSWLVKLVGLFRGDFKDFDHPIKLIDSGDIICLFYSLSAALAGWIRNLHSSL